MFAEVRSRNKVRSPYPAPRRTLRTGGQSSTTSPGRLSGRLR
jgi:hypothetical protein